MVNKSKPRLTMNGKSVTIRASILVEHDLFGKPASITGSSPVQAFSGSCSKCRDSGAEYRSRRPIRRELPVHTTRPRSMMVWRSAMRVSACTFLSMTRIDWPAARRLCRQRQISSRMSGASPSVASSRMRRRGLVISARPIASICCSPPDSRFAMVPARLASRGNSASTFSSVHGALAAVRLAAVATRFSRVVRLGKTWRPSGTSPMPSFATR